MLNDAGKSRTLLSPVDHDEGHKDIWGRKRKSGANLQALTRMKRGAGKHAYARDRHEKSYQDYQNQATMKGDETGIKGFSEDLAAPKLSINNGKETNSI